MTDKEKELIVYCLKANSYFHGEVCEECKNYPKCDHFQYDSLMEKLIKALEQEPCEDAVSRQVVKEQMIKYGFLAPDMTVAEFVEDCLSPVNSQKLGHCKDCKYFEYDSVAKVGGIPLIVAHEICNKWGDGCKTSEEGFCFLFEPQESEVAE